MTTRLLTVLAMTSLLAGCTTGSGTAPPNDPNDGTRTAPWPRFTYDDATWGGAVVLQASQVLNPGQFQGAGDSLDAFAYFATPTTTPLVHAVPEQLGCGAPEALVDGSFVLLDVGDTVELSGPAGALSLPRQAGPTYYPADRIPGTAELVADASYDVASSGGSTLGSVEQTGVLRAPEDFSVIAPDIASYPYLVVSRSTDLTLEWTAPRGRDSAFYVQLEGWAADQPTGEIVRCWGDDTGSIVIPTGVLAQLPLADRMLVKLVRRVDTQWQVPANESLAQGVSTLEKAGVLGLE